MFYKTKKGFALWALALFLAITSACKFLTKGSLFNRKKVLCREMREENVQKINPSAGRRKWCQLHHVKLILWVLRNPSLLITFNIHYVTSDGPNKLLAKACWKFFLGQSCPVLIGLRLPPTMVVILGYAPSDHPRRLTSHKAFLMVLLWYFIRSIHPSR